MSYDLRLFHVPDGADASAVYQQMIEQEEKAVSDLDAWVQRPVPEPARAEMRTIADALKAWRPTLVEFQPKKPLPWIDLDDETLNIQFSVHEGSVGVTMPYFRDQARKMMECVIGCMQTLGPSGYCAYDPQLGRIVTPADIDQMATLYRDMDRALPAIRAHNTATKKPWWKFW